MTDESTMSEAAGEPSRSPDDDDASDPTDAQVLLAAYRHDVHKLRGRSHEAAAEAIAGEPVNEPVPRGADGDAALLSRPRGQPEQTVANHVTPHRLSVRTGTPAVARRSGSPDIETVVRALVTIDDPVAAHRSWLHSEVAALFNESAYYPYTSLKYHVLLTAALLSNYRAGAAFEDLSLVVDDPASDPVPHRTVLATDAVALRVTADPGDQPAASLGSAPARSFADVWNRLPAQPLAVDEQRRWRVLDAQLRRIRSWSAALQYIEDTVMAGARPDGPRTGGAD